MHKNNKTGVGEIDVFVLFCFVGLNTLIYFLKKINNIYLVIKTNVNRPNFSI